MLGSAPVLIVWVSVHSQYASSDGPDRLVFFPSSLLCAGKEYELPEPERHAIHGELRKREWQVVSQEER